MIGVQTKAPKPKVLLPTGKSKRLENKSALCEMFAKRLDRTITENNHRKQPYFITYKIKFDRQNPTFAKDLMIVTQVIPQMIAGTITYKIDNKKGTKELLRVIDP